MEEGSDGEDNDDDDDDEDEDEDDGGEERYSYFHSEGTVTTVNTYGDGILRDDREEGCCISLSR